MKLHVPATTTNFGAGFDTFGLALELENTFEVEEADAFGVEIEGEGKDLPRDESNLVIRVYLRACEYFGVQPRKFRLRQRNGVPTSRGLGSSATAIVGGVEICAALHGVEASLEEKLRIAFEFEPHPDNILPAFVGGFVVCVRNRGLLFNRHTFPEDVRLVFAVPDFELSTAQARKALRECVDLGDCVFNVQRASLMVSALLTRRYDLLRAAVEDRLHQPHRAKLIPGFGEVLSAGYSAGAYAVFLSGAGPTVCALSDPERAQGIGESMREAFRTAGVNSRVMVLRASERGAYWDEAPDP